MDNLEQRARKICAAYGVDPDEIVDEYGPVRRLDDALYHLHAIQSRERERLIALWYAHETLPDSLSLSELLGRTDDGEE